jgi:hypothetical protein
LSLFKKPTTLGLISLVLAFALYGWFVRPYLGSAKLFADPYSETILTLSNHENWLRLGWYLSPIGIWLGVLGCCFLIWRFDRRAALLLGVGLLFSAVYLWSARANPHHVYVMRRYVPVVVPFFIASTAVMLGSLLNKARDNGENPGRRMPYGSAIIGGFLLIIWLLGLGWSARGFISQVDHLGVVDQLVALDESLDPNSILLFNDQSPVGLGDFWGTPLKFIFGHDVFILRDLDALHGQQLAELIDIWQNNGQAVVWIGDPEWLDEYGFSYQETTKVIISQRLESSYEHKPQVIVPVSWTLMMALIDER